MLECLRISELSNGIKVVTLSKPDVESVSVAIRARVGSRNEPEALNGASHFIEHMLFKGTHRRSAKVISQTIEGQGGVINAFTDKDNTCYYATVPYEKEAIALDVLSDLFYNATFDSKELDRERNVIAEEIRMYDDQPDSVAADQLMSQLWSGHPLGRTVLGPIDTILSMPRKELLTYRKEQYAPMRTVFSFAGRVNHEKCVREVSRIAGKLRNPRHLREPEPFTRAIPLDPFALIRRPIQQTQIAFGWRAPGVSSGDVSAPFTFLSCVLGENMSSRLFQSIRERRGLCYSICSDYTSLTDCGCLTIAAGCDPAKAYGGARAILAEIRKLAERPVGAAELRRTCDYLCGRFRLRMDSSPAGWVSSRVLFGVDVNATAVLERYREVTAADIQAAAQTLTAEALAMTVVAPESALHTAEQWANLARELV
ncbi:MAG: pitrilysin family protein [Kiritimatiellia bacterium]